MTWDEFWSTVLFPKIVEVAWRLVAAALILIIGSLLAKFVIKRVKHGRVFARMDETVHGFFVAFVKISVYVILALLIVAALGVNMASIVAAVGSVGLAISLAVQGTLTNLASGIMLLVFRPFKEGDYIESDGVGGTVDELGIFYTTLYTPDNKKVVIPNGTVASNVLTNYSAKSTRRLEIALDMAYGTDLELAKGIIRGVLERHGEVLSEPAPFIRMTEMGDHGIIFKVRVWCKSEDYWTLNFNLLEDFYDSLEKEGIHVPYQQMDIHIKKDE